MFGLGDKNAKTCALFEAIMAGEMEKAKELLVADIEMVNVRASKAVCKRLPDLEDECTPLLAAAAAGQDTMARMLLGLKADPSLRSLSGATAMHLAAAAGHPGIVELLIDEGASLTAPDGSGRHPMHLAAMNGRPRVAELLISRKAPADIKDAEGNTPLHYAARFTHKQIVLILSALKAEINSQNEKGQTPLHEAVLVDGRSLFAQRTEQINADEEASQAMVNLLLRLGADINAVDASGQTPLDLVTFLKGDPLANPLVQLLRANGAEWVRYRSRFANVAPATPATASQPVAGMEVTMASGRTPKPETSVAPPVIMLSEKPMIIGRDSSCDVRFEDRTVSRRHTRIEKAGDSYTVTDLDSRNGTVVNGVVTMGTHPLRSGDLLTLGAFHYRLDGSRLVLRKDTSEAAQQVAGSAKA